ncbi:MAG: TerB family tellurite resistance protein [Alphaproteobacteria bacterium]|nr:TerB family tellurite resistance protein [Alphaproteobacteria bacterium]
MLGLAAGGPVGAAFGFLIGHLYDHRDRDVSSDPPGFFEKAITGFTGTAQQMAFTVGVIVLGAKMAKVDGRVTHAEIEAFKRVFQVTPAQEDRIAHLFNRARETASGFEPYAFHLAQLFRNKSAVLEEVLGGLFIIAAADSAGLRPAEIRFLEKVAGIFNFTAEDFSRIAAQAGVRLPDREVKGETHEAYAVLGVRADASAADIKLAYRALIREHHPDRLVAQGMPPELIANANEKMKRINAAYDALCKLKGIV